MIKRRHQRIAMQNLVANVSDGADSFSGTVSDISRNGLLLTDIAPGLGNQRGEMSILFSVKGRDIKMFVVPKWVSGINSGQKMGLAILEPPLEWTIYVISCEPAGEDIWAATTHLPGF
jgi:hypothetical protein